MYSGWLIKWGEYTIPTKKFIRADSYKPRVYMQVVGEWTDGNGYVHYDAVNLKAAKVEFETPAMLTDLDFEEFMSNIRKNYIDAVGRKGMLTMYVPELGDYVTQYAYLADIEPQIYGNYGGRIHYQPIRIAFIGGVYRD